MKSIFGFRTARRTPSRKAPAIRYFRPRLEGMESRDVPATVGPALIGAPVINSVNLVGVTPASGTANEVLNLVTTCEELSFPWSSTATPADRIHQAAAAARGIPRAAVAPFDASTALLQGPVAECAGWPETPGPGPVPAGPLAGSNVTAW